MQRRHTKDKKPLESQQALNETARYNALPSLLILPFEVKYKRTIQKNKNIGLNI